MVVVGDASPEEIRLDFLLGGLCEFPIDLVVRGRHTDESRDDSIVVLVLHDGSDLAVEEVTSGG